MGMCAEILCIGPFQPELIDHYEYPGEYYKAVIIGNPIITLLFGITEGGSASRDVAESMGITDPWDFNQHKIDVSKINLASLEEVLVGLVGWEDDNYKDDLASLKAFIKYGYDFYFIPNG